MCGSRKTTETPEEPHFSSRVRMESCLAPSPFPLLRLTSHLARPHWLPFRFLLVGSGRLLEHDMPLLRHARRSRRRRWAVQVPALRAKAYVPDAGKRPSCRCRKGRRADAGGGGHCSERRRRRRWAEGPRVRRVRRRPSHQVRFFCARSCVRARAPATTSIY